MVNIWDSRTAKFGYSHFERLIFEDLGEGKRAYLKCCVGQRFLLNLQAV